MKNLYKIHEIARLFHLHPDTLRYYEEKGLLHPVRGKSNYRMYTIQDICTLNVIRSLRELDLPTEEIRTYLERRSVEETLSFLDRQETLLEDKLALLRAAGQEVRRRRERLERYRTVPEGQVSIREEGARPYVFLRENVILEKEIDFLLKKLEGRHQDYIKVIGAQTLDRLLEMLLENIRARGLTPAAPPLELYHIDVHDTRQESEYVTELQMLVHR